MNTVPLAAVDLVLLVTAAGFGAASLFKWSRFRHAGFPTAKIVTHISLQAVAICVWFFFVLTSAVAVAWIAFIVLTAGQVFGDLLMFVSHRARHPDRVAPSYLQVGGDVLSFKRPAAALHAIFGAVAWFGMLAICIIATVGA